LDHPEQHVLNVKRQILSAKEQTPTAKSRKALPGSPPPELPREQYMFLAAAGKDNFSNVTEGNGDRWVIGVLQNWAIAFCGRSEEGLGVKLPMLLAESLRTLLHL